MTNNKESLIAFARGLRHLVGLTTQDRRYIQYAIEKMEQGR